MVSVSFIIQVLGAIVGIISLITGSYARFLEHPEDRYGEKVKELQSKRWGDAAAILGELFVDIEESYNPNSEEAEERVPLAERYGLHIKKQFERGELTALEESLEAVDKPRECYEKVRSTRDEIYTESMAVVVACLGSVVIIFISNTLLAVVLSGSILTFGGMLFATVLLKIQQYKQSREHIDEMWEDYEFM